MPRFIPLRAVSIGLCLVAFLVTAANTGLALANGEAERAALFLIMSANVLAFGGAAVTGARQPC